jgi:2-polyprenyl-3-methyl-5-hydroxy-6-metoxy-1,4-benzoquinol methylase
MHESQATPKFTGEYFIPGESGERIEADHMERYKFASRYARGKSVLDIACGVGYSAPILVASGATSYDGVDINEGLTSYANQHFGAEAVRYHTGDIRTFVTGRQYDLITCFETIEHVQDYRSALLNLHRLLKEGGLLLISSPNRRITSPDCRILSDKPANRFHTQEFVPDELLTALRDAGFSARHSDVFGQRQRFRGLASMRRIAPGLVSRLERAVDRLASPAPTPAKRLHDSRYFLVAASK